MLEFHKEQEYPDVNWTDAVKKPVPVQAVLVEVPVVCATLEGDVQVGAGDVVMCGVKGEYYPIERQKFDEWYGRDVGLVVADVEVGFRFESGQEYDFGWCTVTKKSVPVGACKMDEDFSVHTPWGYLIGKPGDYAAITADVFAETYELCD